MLQSIKPFLLPCFISKWSNHEHSVPHCNKTITIDGNWKIYRTKCIEENRVFISPEFGSFNIGCHETPKRKSYHCEKHINSETKLLIDGQYVCVNPNTIKPIRLS